MPDHDFPTLDVAQAGQRLAQLYEQIAQQRGRVEIRSPGSAETCVIISKAELEGLERALEILADSDSIRELCHHLSHLAHTSHDQYCAP